MVRLPETTNREVTPPPTSSQELTVTLYPADCVQEDLTVVQQDLVGGVPGLPAQQGQQVAPINLPARGQAGSITFRLTSHGLWTST